RQLLILEINGVAPAGQQTSRRLALAQLDQDLSAGAQAHRVGLDAAVAVQGAAAGQVELERVQGADHGAAAEQAVGEHATAMRAFGLSSVDCALPAAKHRQAPAADYESAALSFGNRGERGERDFHGCCLGEPGAPKATGQSAAAKRTGLQSWD